jgi:hypothetical protein
VKNVKLIRSTGSDFLDELWRTSTSRADFVLTFTINWGSVEIREAINDDLALIRGLRILLPPYTGPAVRLYRGEPPDDHGGISWTRDRKVGDLHARARRPSVLLETYAPPAAIIHRLTDKETGGEREYFVDYPRLPRVTIVKRYTDEYLECRDQVQR